MDNNNHVVNLPPLMDKNTTKTEQTKQFSDRSCQERSIVIDRLVDISADIIDSIWTKKSTSVKVISTSIFIREILKRSRATYSMLQLSLFYIFRIRNIVIARMAKPNLPFNEIISCGRRMFLAALILSSKYLHDKNYKNKTWSKIASLDTNEINTTETVFLKLIDYQLYVSKPLYERWVSLLHEHIQKKKQMKQPNNDHPIIPHRNCCEYHQGQSSLLSLSSLPSLTTVPKVTMPTVTQPPGDSPDHSNNSTPVSEIDTPPPVMDTFKRRCSLVTEFDHLANKHPRLS